MKNVRRKLEIPMPAAIEKNKANYACVVDADESMRIRLEGSTAQVSRRSHLGKRNKFVEPLQFGTQVCSDASRIEDTKCKGSSGKIMGKIGEDSGMAADKK